DCHGGHNILPSSDPQAMTAVMNVPVLCGRCHREGSEVSLNREISQDNILEFYSMSIHGDGSARSSTGLDSRCRAFRYRSNRLWSNIAPIVTKINDR
ncbi:MAG: hypothetical protein ACE5GX_17425, partial [Thermoanaerobaculia bacterium]